MKNQIFRIMLLSGFTLFTGNLVAKNLTILQVSNFQKDLLSEYEERFILIEKQFAEFKKQIAPEKMSKLDVKMKMGGFENTQNSLKAKLRDLRKSTAPLSATDKGDLDTRFKKLTTDYDSLKKLTE